MKSRIRSAAARARQLESKNKRAEQEAPQTQVTYPPAPPPRPTPRELRPKATEGSILSQPVAAVPPLASRVPAPTRSPAASGRTHRSTPRHACPVGEPRLRPPVAHPPASPSATAPPQVTTPRPAPRRPGGAVPPRWDASPVHSVTASPPSAVQLNQHAYVGNATSLWAPRARFLHRSDSGVPLAWAAGVRPNLTYADDAPPQCEPQSGQGERGHTSAARPRVIQTVPYG